MQAHRDPWEAPDDRAADTAGRAVIGIRARPDRPAATVRGDAEPIRRSLTEPDAFTAVYDRHVPAARYLLLERLGGETAAEPVDSEARVIAQALRGPLARALADLPAVYREPLLLVAWADLTYEEVAAAPDVPVGTVRSRLSRGRARLRAALGGADPTEEDTDG
ncbi:RNA polymerase sigma factor [Actinomadura montaniterrae]|uniref:RNA polymerase sigma factor n=1 Tax=Actinomadura montaniterrae TaxID=1803903 RepID=A0A6L3VGE1_9ACTN|nr:RNA polymerase sigma factor [Actinomadura montaniterrae]KAB2358390.1 RNA polymerase sigma factor [Actinomadura montaniterrae]